MAKPAQAQRSEENQSRYEATFAVLLVIVLQATVAGASLNGGWKTLSAGGWVWLLPVPAELALLASLGWGPPRRRLEQAGMRRRVSLILTGVICAANGVAVLALIASLLKVGSQTGGELLLKGGTVWVTNVIAFGLVYWELDRGGPQARVGKDSKQAPDFRFTQDDTPEFAEEGWSAGLVDYVFVAYTNAIAFSPTDTMPLTSRAKLLMLCESFAAALVVLLVAAHAVGILK